MFSISVAPKGSQARKGTILEFLDELTPEALEDFNSFVRTANNVKRFAKSCNPSVVREVAKLEKFKRAAIETIRAGWLKKRVISDNAARMAIDYIHELYNEAIDEAEYGLEVCLKK